MTESENKKIFNPVSPKLFELMQFNGRDDGKYHCYYGVESSFENGTKRKESAVEQKNKALDETADDLINRIIEITNTFLEEIGVEVKRYNNKTKINTKELPILRKPRSRKDTIDYGVFKNECGLNSESHIIWMKFAKEKNHQIDRRYLGVVAASNDIDFSTSNTSGKIISSLDLEWDESFILLFPLPRITDGMRKDIEVGIGNNLIDNEVPILDFYSHRYN